MTETNTPAAATIDWNERARAQYLDPEAAIARVNRETTDRNRVARARYMLTVARNPRNLFDLTAEQIPATVIAALQAIVDTLAPASDAAVHALALRHAELEAEGFASDERWNILEDDAAPLGFRYGDSETLRAIARGLAA
jgi:MoxR-like ATPase